MVPLREATLSPGSASTRMHVETGVVELATSPILWMYAHVSGLFPASLRPIGRFGKRGSDPGQGLDAILLNSLPWLGLA